MQISDTSYLKVIRAQLASLLGQQKNSSNQKALLYCHRILTQLFLSSRTMPALQQNALHDYNQVLDDLTAALHLVEGNEMLIQDLELHVRISPNYSAAERAMQNTAEVLVSKPSPTNNQLVCKIAAIELARQNALHAAALAEEPRLPTADNRTKVLEDNQIDKLKICIKQIYPEEHTLEIGAITTVAGGGSKQTLFVQLLNVKDLPGAVVLRIDRAASPTGSEVVNEFEIIRTMFDAGIPVPRPYAVITDLSVVGAAFIILGKVDGDNIGDGIDVTEPSRSFAVSLAQTLAKMHAIAPEKAGNLLTGAKVTTTQRIWGEIEEFENKWRASGQSSIALGLTYAWLKDHVRFAEGKRAIIHRDVGCHNLLEKNGHVAALLDWETAAIGNPAQDLAFSYHTVIQLMPWDEFLAEYEKAGGVIPTCAEIDFYRLWRSAWVMGLLELVRTYVLSDATEDIFHAYAAQCFYQRSEQLLNEVLSLVLERYQESIE